MTEHSSSTSSGFTVSPRVYVWEVPLGQFFPSLACRDCEFPEAERVIVVAVAPWMVLWHQMCGSVRDAEMPISEVERVAGKASVVGPEQVAKFPGLVEIVTGLGSRVRATRPQEPISARTQAEFYPRSVVEWERYRRVADDFCDNEFGGNMDEILMVPITRRELRAIGTAVAPTHADPRRQAAFEIITAILRDVHARRRDLSELDGVSAQDAEAVRDAVAAHQQGSAMLLHLLAWADSSVSHDVRDREYEQIMKRGRVLTRRAHRRERQAAEDLADTAEAVERAEAP